MCLLFQRYDCHAVFAAFPAKVDLENKKAVVTSKEEINADAVKAAIDAAGFTVTDIVRK